MTIKPDYWIIEQSAFGMTKPMIDPFSPAQIKEIDNHKIVSCGLSSYGYDFRIGQDIKVFTNTNAGVIDPKQFNSRSLVQARLHSDNGEYVIIPPNSFALGASVEFFRIPVNVLALVLGKSTYARCGIITNFTPLEPGWEGHITIEISNTTPLPARIYINEGIAQALFFEGEPCDVNYADRDGKYQGQIGVTLARV